MLLLGFSSKQIQSVTQLATWLMAHTNGGCEMLGALGPPQHPQKGLQGKTPPYLFISACTTDVLAQLAALHGIALHSITDLSEHESCCTVLSLSANSNIIIVIRLCVLRPDLR